MRKLLIFFVCVLLSTGLFAAISGSAHDFSAGGWTPNGRICVACHTPHNSDTTVADAPLWNHAVSAAAFTPYGTTLAGTAVGAPNSVSLLCLSCHDGVTNIDAFGGSSGTQDLPTAYPGTTTNLDTDLTDDHPVSVVYNVANDLNPITTATGVGTDTIADWLFNSGTTVECSSCHDVHNKYGNTMLLKLDNTGSALCLLCHAK
ncbi:MAG: cytochrome c3 family protein [Candidatus Aminicenantes bacterium]|jgi:predicted CXXCH cytochrome family protein